MLRTSCCCATPATSCRCHPRVMRLFNSHVRRLSVPDNLIDIKSIDHRPFLLLRNTGKLLTGPPAVECTLLGRRANAQDLLLLRNTGNQLPVPPAVLPGSPVIISVTRLTQNASKNGTLKDIKFLSKSIFLHCSNLHHPKYNLQIGPF